MKSKTLRLIQNVSFLVITFASPGRAADTSIISQEVLQAKADYCITCHGSSGQGNHGSTPIPRLAGQEPIYFENQLKAFADRRRDNQNMYNVSHEPSAELRTALAKHFKSLNLAPLGGAPSDRINAGKKLYSEGVPDKVVRCTLCHTATGRGDGGIPRLAGQVNDYIINKLTNWNKQRGLNREKRDASSIMQPIVHDLSKSQIEEVAAYLSSLD